MQTSSKLKPPSQALPLPATPRLLTPVSGAAVDAHAVTFEWESAGARTYVLELARDASFDTVLCRLPAGKSTSVTAYDVFHKTDTTYYWRVESLGAHGVPIKSETESFLASPYALVVATEERQRPGPARGSAGAVRSDATRRPAPRLSEETQHSRLLAPDQRPTPSQEEATMTPHRTGATSMREALTAVILMIVSFILTLAYLFSAAVGI